MELFCCTLEYLKPFSNELLFYPLYVPLHLLQCDIRGQRTLTVLLVLPEQGNHLQTLKIYCEISRSVGYHRCFANTQLGSGYFGGVIQPCPFDMSESRPEI